MKDLNLLKSIVDLNSSDKEFHKTEATYRNDFDMRRSSAVEQMEFW